MDACPAPCPGRAIRLGRELGRRGRFPGRRRGRIAAPSPVRAGNSRPAGDTPPATTGPRNRTDGPQGRPSARLGRRSPSAEPGRGAAAAASMPPALSRAGRWPRPRRHHAWRAIREAWLTAGATGRFPQAIPGHGRRWPSGGSQGGWRHGGGKRAAWSQRHSKNGRARRNRTRPKGRSVGRPAVVGESTGCRGLSGGVAFVQWGVGDRVEHLHCTMSWLSPA